MTISNWIGSLMLLIPGLLGIIGVLHEIIEECGLLEGTIILGLFIWAGVAVYLMV